MTYVLGPKNFMRGERNDNARLQKLERQYAELMKQNTDLLARVEALEAKRGPGRPPKPKEEAA